MNDVWHDVLRDLEGVRAVRPRIGVSTRDDGDDALPTLFGHFSVFDRWYEINSLFEGRFIERVAPGAFRKTFDEQRDAIRVLFDHGHDPQIGKKVLGSKRDLREDKVGAFYEVDLHDTSYVRDLLPGLQAGEYGASFRFRVIKDEWNDEPERSDHNPDGLPERTILEMRVFEFGPVTFPASPSATAGVRSLTDDYYQRAPDRDRHNDLLARARECALPVGEPRPSTVEPPPGTRRTPRDAAQMLRRIDTIHIGG